MAEETKDIPQKISEEFSILFPGADIKKVGISEVPESPLNFFKDRSLWLTNNKKYIPDSLDSFYKIRYQDGSISYVATQTKTYATNGDTEKLVYIYDEDAQHNEIGYGEIRYNEMRKDNYFKNKPFVGFTTTGENYKKQGFGTRRLKTMNALSLRMFGLPIHSDTLIGEESKRIWQRLLKNGETYSYLQDKMPRFAFKR